MRLPGRALTAAAVLLLLQRQRHHPVQLLLGHGGGGPGRGCGPVGLSLELSGQCGVRGQLCCRLAGGGSLGGGALTGVVLEKQFMKKGWSKSKCKST